MMSEASSAADQEPMASLSAPRATPAATSASRLTEEQRARIERNKAEALKKKAVKEAAAGGSTAAADSAAGISAGIVRARGGGGSSIVGGSAGGGGWGGRGRTHTSDGSLEDTLREFFGYTKFRHEQQAVCEAVLQGRDVSVFWATGSGKSLCYQVPAFHLEKTVIVVSPLISLMNDQVTTLNNKIDMGSKASCHNGRMLPPATFLGTAGNPLDEEPALQGLFRLVYVTPEKLAGRFLENLAPLAQAGKLALVAIDEAHCVSQWGPDFRPSFFDLRQVREALPSVPLMALTATAVPRVKEDIQTILQLHDAFVSTSSFDRPNLKISVHRKASLAADLHSLVQTLSNQTSGSTLVYVPTIAETETVARHLSDKLPGVNVGFYHGSVALDVRDRVHSQFLSGEAQVVVATQAFGMGIDKPDIRRILHYGAPKTFEEYYQQVGRAGRDGAPAVCDMYCSEQDFKKYDSEFYTAKLSETAKAAVKESTDALRDFANNHERCRRRSILAFFRETPAWGERCGTCDTCIRHKSGDLDLKRDFSAEAALLLGAVSACGQKPQSTTKLLNLVGSGDIYAVDVAESKRLRLNAMRKALPRATRTDDMLKEMLVSLKSAGYLSRKSVSALVSGRSLTWEVHELTGKGQAWLAQAESQRDAIMLPMPQVMIDAAKAAKRRAEEAIAELKSAGVSMDQVPAEELEEGAGEVMTVLSMWVRTLQRLRSPESSSQSSLERADHLEAVLKDVQRWRDDKARQLKISPAAVLPDFLAMKIIHARATDTEALTAAGVRIKGVGELASLMLSHFPPASSTSAAGDGGPGGADSRCAADGRMVLPAGEFAMAKPWMHSVYKVCRRLPVRAHVCRSLAGSP
jgi:RecQ family ATP-dependent DNA helicase